MDNIGLQEKSYKLLLAIVLCISCSGKDQYTIVEGDLYFDIDRIGSFYGMPDSAIVRIKKSIDSLRLLTDHSGDQEFLNIYDALNQHRVLYKPFVDVYMRGDSVVKLYIDSTDYSRLSNYSYRELIYKKKKVTIMAKAHMIRKGYYDCIELNDVEYTDGETYPIYKSN